MAQRGGDEWQRSCASVESPARVTPTGLDPSAAYRHGENMSERNPWFTGQLLLALPGMGDRRFEQAVIAMINHDDDGAMGVGISKLLDGLTVGAVMDQLKIAHEDPLAIPVYYGGPVEPSRGFVLHSKDWAGADSVQVADRWMLSSSHDILRAIAEGRGPSRYLVSLGYAGWAAGQLEDELVHHGWHVTKANDDIVYDARPDDKWHQAFSEAGIDTRLLTIKGGEA